MKITWKTAWVAGLLATGIFVAVPPAHAARRTEKPVPAEAPDPAPPEPPTVPEAAPGSPHAGIPPMPPRLPRIVHPSSSTPRYFLKEGETHKGDLYFFSESVRIAGTQEGDLNVFAREISVTGTVTGDINAAVESAELGGTMGDAVRVTCNSVTVTGTINGDLIALCGTVLIEKEAHITGSVDAKGANVEVHGVIDGDLDATSGEIALSGKVGGDATLKADVINVDPGAHIAGDLEYTSRDRVDFNKDKVVHGEVSYTPEKKHPPVSRGGFLKWFFFTATALLAGLGALAIFRKSAPAIVAAVGGDALRSAGIGFITAIVVPVAAALSCILIITIPAVVLVFMAYFLLLYLAQAPVALWLGEQVLRRMNRATASPFVALAVGTPLLYAVFSIPYLGKLALFAVTFTGFGAIVITIWTARQARRGGGIPAALDVPTAPAQA